jgi:membrane associated rhomboid family serine protease/Zn-finger nucleic acid-binding protein
MFTCPRCKSGLSREQVSAGVFWDCPRCHGRAVGLGLLRRVVDERWVRAAWGAALQAAQSDGCSCPVCSRGMAAVQLDFDGKTPQLEICRRCEFSWFDAGQYELFPPPPPKPHVLGDVREWEMPATAREALAFERVEQLAKEQNDNPDVELKTLPVFLGLPVEMDESPLKHIPWATYLASAVIAAMSIGAWSTHDFGNAVRQWGFIPSQPWRDHGVTFLTSFFLHANWLHLAGNLYFFVIFGRHVEDYLSRSRWLLLLLLATVAGDLLEMLLQPGEVSPCIGASGGISGLLTFYALKFPHAQLGVLFYFRLIRIPAWGVFGFWLLFQFVGAITEMQHLSSVASIAHLGGCAAGLAGWFLWRKIDETRIASAPGSPLVITRS